MDPAFILAIVKMTMDVLKNHTGKPTPEEVAITISNELISGQTLITEWFAKKNLPPPK